MKSHVSLEQGCCLVCCKTYDTGSILLDRRLRDSLEPQTVTGWGLCPEHRKLHDEGFVALIECDPAKSGTPSPAGLLKPEDAHRTGVVAHLKREAFSRLIGRVISETTPAVFIEPGLIAFLQAQVDVQH